VIRPTLQGAALLADIRAATNLPGFRLWWLGQSGFLLQWQGHHLLFDPYLSDSLTEKYAATDKPHVRMTELAIAPQQLDFVDTVTCSHNHTDHLDAQTLQPLLNANPNFDVVIPEANRQFVCDRLQCALDWPLGFNDGETKQVGPWQFTGIAAAHDELQTDAAGRHHFLGYVVKFGPVTIYHSGDTRLYDGLAERLRPHRVDIALLPINGYKAERRVAGNMSGSEAAHLAKEIGAGIVIPHHFEMFEFNTASPDEFVAECERLAQPYRVLKCGERWSSEDLETK
jgi:L-ascorbate metabolism protein UlaG (beta-lactamase superfamily)